MRNADLPLNWVDFWNSKACSPTDFQATGRGLMDVVGFLYTVHEIVRLLAPKPEDVMLDVGCGTGLIALGMAPWLSKINAFDISPNMVDRARKNLSHVPNVNVEVGSITRLDVGEATHDKLLAYSVLQYLSSEEMIKQSFSEIHRVLRPRGKALLAANPDPDRRWLLEDVINSRADKEASAKELQLQSTLLWLAPDRLCELARASGLVPRVEAINERIWQHFYMFDLILERP